MNRSISAFAALGITLAAGCANAASTDYIFKFPFTSVLAPTDSGVSIGPAGTLIGATRDGGGDGAQGTVFQLLPPSPPSARWTKKTLAVFWGATLGGKDGERPSSELSLADDGSIFGTTEGGGGDADAGTVFRLIPPSGEEAGWTKRIIYRFRGGIDGDIPAGKLLLNDDGSIFGTTFAGGRDCGGTSCGTVYRMIPSDDPLQEWRKEVVYRFRIDDLVAKPIWLARGPGRVLYGVAGGFFGQVWNGIFSLTPRLEGQPWRLRTLHVFDGGRNDGLGVNPAIVVTERGEIFGQTSHGGRFQSPGCEDSFGAAGCGTLFRLSPTPGTAPWTFTILHHFSDRQIGGVQQPNWPSAGLIASPRKANSFLGITAGGGSGWGGTVYEVTVPPGSSGPVKVNVLHDALGNCCGRLLKGPGGAIFGTTGLGQDSNGAWNGSVFRTLPRARY